MQDSISCYHTLAVAESPSRSESLEKSALAMTKREILDFFAQTGGFLTPDELRVRLHWRLDRRSAYSYLQRLARQGLLERSPWGRLAYRLTSRGHARLQYLRTKKPMSQPDPARLRFPWERA